MILCDDCKNNSKSDGGNVCTIPKVSKIEFTDGVMTFCSGYIKGIFTPKQLKEEKNKNAENRK